MKVPLGAYQDSPKEDQRLEYNKILTRIDEHDADLTKSDAPRCITGTKSC